MYSEPRQKFLLYLLFIAIFITVLAGQYWKFWFILPFSIFVWWLCDAMFFTRNMFMYEPNYHYWKEANEEDF